MTPSERREFSNTLSKLQDRGQLPLDIWVELVGNAIRKACPPESRVQTRLRKLESDTEASEEAYRELLTTAQRILDLMPTESPDPALEREVLLILKDKFFTSTAFKALIVVTGVLLLLSVGGTMFYGTKIKGFVKTTDEAVEKVQGLVGKAYIDTKTEMEQRLKAIESDLLRAKGDEEKGTGALGEIRRKKETALAAIKETTGNEEKGTGALGAIWSRKDDAIRMINESLGNKDQPGTVLWEIDEERSIVLKKIDDALNGKTNGGGALGAMEEARSAALSKLEQKRKEIALQMDQSLDDVPARVVNMETRLSELEIKIDQSYQQLATVTDSATDFIPVASKVQEAHKILKEGFKGVEPREVVSLLSVSTVVLTGMSIVSLLAVVLACLAIWKTWSAARDSDPNRNT